MAVRPLTRRGKDGRVLTRAHDVEAQIAEALALEPIDLQRRIAVDDREDSLFLKEETLVHLLREYHRRNDEEICNLLAKALQRRCLPQARKYLSSLGDREFDSAHCDLISELFERILDLTGGRGDFFEVRFGRGFKFLAIDTFDRCTAQINADTENLLPLSSLAGNDGDDESEERHSVPSVTIHQATVLDERRVLAKEALAELPEPQRTAFILRHYDKWPIESKDPRVPTISKHFKRTPRTIQDWLEMCEVTLKRWRGED